MGVGDTVGGSVGFDDVLGELDDLSGNDVPDDLSSQGVDRGGLRADHVSVVELADAEGPDSEGVPDAEEPAVDHEGECVGALDLGHDGLDRLDGILVLTHAAADEIDDEFGVGVGLEGRTLRHVGGLELLVVGEVAVMCQCNHSEGGGHDHRLGVHTAFR